MIRSLLAASLAAFILVLGGCSPGSTGGGIKPTVKESGPKDGPPPKQKPAGPPTGGGDNKPIPE
ncbi:MAG: hypothetical protein K2W96_06980 [Gemmataceae bacterium]|nr:hypothetical protein [Gemmataceae bacterium]